MKLISAKVARRDDCAGRVMDFEREPRLCSSGRGNAAMLVGAASPNLPILRMFVIRRIQG